MIHKKRKYIHKKNIKANTSFFEKIKKVLTIVLILFFGTIILTQQDSLLEELSTTSEEVVFVLPGTPTDRWMEEGVHGSADDWSYLFENSWESDWSTNNVTIIETTTLPSNDNDIPHDKDYFPFDDEEITEEGVFTSWNIQTWLFLSGQQLSWSENQEDKICIAPWWEYVAAWDFVLAYEQRKDVTNLCNVQKRYCIQGNLEWTYQQKSCKENTLYTYIKPEAISYTDKGIDPFLQPSDPSLSWADFDVHGKIESTETVIDDWWSNGSWRPSDTVYTQQSIDPNIKCLTPWWEPIKNGQFVKAYKTSIGLIDLPCEVEIRLCVKWKLKWSYQNRTCTFKKMTYRDYLVQNYDENSPTIGDLMNTIDTNESQTTYNSWSFWRWLDKYF